MELFPSDVPEIASASFNATEKTSRFFEVFAASEPTAAGSFDRPVTCTSVKKHKESSGFRGSVGDFTLFQHRKNHSMKDLRL